MQLRSSICWRKWSNLPPSSCYKNAFILASLLIAGVSGIGDDSCDATSTDTTTGEIICAPSHDHIMYDDANVDEENREETNGLPTWWNYNIDQLFEDHFDCGEIIYGYENSDDDDDDQVDDGEYVSDDVSDDDDSSDDDDEDFDIENNGKHKSDKTNISKNADVVSDNQLQNLRHQWAVIREKYVKEILVPIDIHYTESDSTVQEGTDHSRDEAATINNFGKSAMVVPNRIGDAGPGKGRGVFATEPITKGTLVVDLANGSTGTFKDGHSWRKFAISLPRETACNFIEWSWVQTIPRVENEIDSDIRNGLTIFVAFDESNLLNAADWDDMEENISCGIPLEDGGRGPCRFHYYAARDIAAGEELLINYGEFEDTNQQGWTDIGL